MKAQPTTKDCFKPFLAFFGFFGILLFCMAGESLITAILPLILDNLMLSAIVVLLVVFLILKPIK